MIETRVAVYPPAEDGGRRVRVGSHFLGIAYTVLDVVEFLRQAGFEDVEREDVTDTGWVEWQGGGPDVWEY
jgi:hypothetical protein